MIELKKKEDDFFLKIDFVQYVNRRSHVYHEYLLKKKSRIIILMVPLELVLWI